MSMHQHPAHLPPAGQPSGRPLQAGSEARPPFWRSKAAVVAVGFLAIGAFLLLSEHRVHAFGYLPFLLLLACPFMHVFMHGGHGGHGDHAGDSDSGERSDRPKKPTEGD